jgi:MFS family permease
MIHTFGGLTGERLNTAIAFFAGCSFFLFGYDMGYMGSVLTQRVSSCSRPPSRLRVLTCLISQSFIETMPSTATNPNIQGITVGIFEIGCLLGALSLLEIGDRLGRRRTVLLGQALILVGGLLQASAFGLPQFLVGRVVAGVGLGLEVATVPPWQSECAKPKSRGYFVMLEGALCSFGVMTSFWVGYA